MNIQLPPQFSPDPPAPRLAVGLILLPEFTLNAFAGFVDALRLAADKGGRSRQIHCTWRILGSGSVTASCGARLALSQPLVDPRQFHYIAVCGGNSYEDRRENARLSAYLREADAANVKLIGLCTGTFALARAGLMEGYRACVHWNVYDSFVDQFPHLEAVPDRIFLDTGKRITCAGSAGATDLALHLIRRHCGPEKVQQAIRHMMLQDARPATYPQAHFYNDLSGVRDSRVRRAANFMEQSLNESVTAQSIADAVGLSTRHLDRIFLASVGMRPLTFFREMRLRYGLWLLKHTDWPVAAIAADCGFSDAAHFSREFRRRHAMSPSSFRRSEAEVIRQSTAPMQAGS